MVTQKGDNTAVVAIHGNFDDAQTGVKQIFADKEFEKELKEKGFVFSSSILPFFRNCCLYLNR